MNDWGKRLGQAVLFTLEVVIGIPIGAALGILIVLVLAVAGFLGIFVGLTRQGIAALRKPQPAPRPVALQPFSAPAVTPKKPPLWMSPWRNGRPN
jgi:hypothetical protein